MYARVIIDISHSAVDRAFTYRVPETIEDRITAGDSVMVPFGKGNQTRSAYVIEITDTSERPDTELKEIIGIDTKKVGVEASLIRLALWMRNRYGGTVYQALSTVVGSKTKVAARKDRSFYFTGSSEELESLFENAVRKKHYAKMRLFAAFKENRRLPAGIVSDRLNITAATIRSLTESGIVKIIEKDRDEAKNEALKDGAYSKKAIVLNTEQQAAVEGILSEKRTVSLLFGITGSGKTEVYLRLIEQVLSEGKEAIVLIPEIALTYQTVMRFYERFGDRIAVVHSRISKGEKCERFEKANAGEVSVMIGPRSALFTPFKHLGIVIIDEFHEQSYHSDQVPKYDSIETAIRRAKETDAKVVLGSATPTVEHYYHALNGEYGLYKLSHRAVSASSLPEVEVVDLREELKAHNRSVFSRSLQQKIEARLVKNEQVMLFLNRRGYSGAVSCRSCGASVMCPHCSLPLHYHLDGKLKCHYCGYTQAMVTTCPDCGSKLIGRFGIGTQKVEEMVKELYPKARVLRMDADTTSGKNGHQEILEKFMNREADILIGTQMIVKGHDFPDVTLVGILAADLSLNVPDYRSAERTFELLTQAEGRAGRKDKPGTCVVQTYMPEHYAVQAAAKQDFEDFYRHEMIYRSQMKYPPKGYFMCLTVASQDYIECHDTIRKIADFAVNRFGNISFLGPAEADVLKVKDTFRMVFYFKADTLKTLLSVKNTLERYAASVIGPRKIYYTFE